MEEKADLIVKPFPFTDSDRAIFRPGMRAYFIPFAAGVVLCVSAFLPWVIVGGQPMKGVPDVAGLWIAGLGAAAALLAI